MLQVAGPTVTCTCGHDAALPGETPISATRKLAAQHQFAIFLLDAAHGTTTVTNCLFCGADLPMTAEDNDAMVAYGIWLTQPCASCGKTPREAVEPVKVSD